MDQLFPTKVAARLAGVSVRCVDYWARTRLLKPGGRSAHGKGSRRRYTFRDVVALKTIANLRALNCPLQKVRAAVDYLKRHYPEQRDSDVLARTTLITDGRTVYVGQDKNTVMNVATRQLSWVVPLGSIIREVFAQVSALPQESIKTVHVGGRVWHLVVTSDPEAGGFVVQCRELPGALEQGDARDEAIANGRSAIAAVLAFQRQRRRLVQAG